MSFKFPVPSHSWCLDFALTLMDNLDSPLWKRALSAANAELPVKVIKFVNNLLSQSADVTPTFITGRSSKTHPGSNILQWRAEAERLNKELFDAELQLDVLWRALSLAKKNYQRVVEKRDSILARINESRVPPGPQLPREIIIQIAGYLRWDRWYNSDPDRGPKTYSSLRRMASAFSVVGDLGDAILRKIPLVFLHPMSYRYDYEWANTFQNLPTSQQEVIGKHPRICRYDDDDVDVDKFSCITPGEEVHLILSLECDASYVCARLLKRLAGRFHLTLFDNGEREFRDFLDTFLHPNLRPRISSLTLRRTVTEGDTETLLVEPREPHTISPSLRLTSPPMPNIRIYSSMSYAPFIRPCKVCA